MSFHELCRSGLLWYETSIHSYHTGAVSMAENAVVILGALTVSVEESGCCVLFCLEWGGGSELNEGLLVRLPSPENLNWTLASPPDRKSVV